MYRFFYHKPSIGLDEIVFSLDVENGVCTIYNSNDVKDPRIMYEFIKKYLSTEPFTSRSWMSYFSEWRAHNLMADANYSLGRTLVVDLQAKESWFKNLLYFILSIFYIGV